ncbi:bifunctional riboflavin kinase/FAD synthetase [Salinarimonas ramus]|uniref:Riboflavin biosynthesis protein n=1 Tax=Salinarimonas ramus TaxID=690164 RepID=A0A917QC79_9HYPH|nr:bifunctional riboflavin kinase/FAD synthetase [Salinarimonas ramus]GGK42705.1 riboflavin biosynthesis protein RibF [Salinarimonas ramus]
MNESRTHVPPAPGRRGPVVAIGNFDGVHRGHRTLLANAREKAAARGVSSAVLTFEPHPRAYFQPDKPLFRITPQAEKARVLARSGVDAVHVRAFDAALAGMSPEAFVDELIAGALDASGVVVGYDFHFGKGRAGTPAILTELCAARGIGCDVVPVVEEAGAPVSSSAIRAALAEGAIARANALLGYRWFVLGEVRHGDKRGRTLGYPTANMALPEGCGLAHGIYAVRLSADDVVRDGVASYGRRPTFDDGAPLLETFVFDFAGDLYGKEVGVELVGFIRGEERFDSAQALIAQMDRDSARARELLAEQDGLESML